MTASSSSRKSKILKALFAVSFTIAVDRYLFSSNSSIAANVTDLSALLIAVYLQNHAAKITNRTTRIFATIFSIILSIVLVIGKAIYDTNTILPLLGASQTLLALVSIIGFSAIFTAGFTILFDSMIKIEKHLQTGKPWRFFQHKHILLILWALFFISFIPPFLAHYPGILSYDQQAQTDQFLNGTISKLNPPTHTLIWGACIRLGEFMNLYPTVIYEFFQVLFMTFVFAKIIKFLIDRKANNWVILFGVLNFVLNPAIAIFTLCMTKDIYFAGFLALMILELCYLSINPKTYFSRWYNWIKFAVIGAAVCLFRNNAFYVLVVFLPLAAIIMKEYRLKTTIQIYDGTLS